MVKLALIMTALIGILAVMVMSTGQRISVTSEPLNVTHFFINQPGKNLTLNVAGWSTGNVLSNEVDLRVGSGEYGALQIGDDIQLAHLDGVGVIGNLNLSNTFLIRHIETSLNNISLLYATGNQIRLAIPVAGPDFALYNPRSMMIGGDLGNSLDDNIIKCSQQGYNNIDCDTDLTGADLGIQDDLEVRGDSFITVPYANMWFENDSTNGVQTIISSADTWTNISGFEQPTQANQTLRGFTFINNNALKADYNGIYQVVYSMSFQKLTGSAQNHLFKTSIFVNDLEQQSLETHRTIKENDAVGVVASSSIISLQKNDIVYLSVQGVSNSIDIGTHVANVNLVRVGNQ